MTNVGATAYSTRIGDAVVEYDRVVPSITVDTDPGCLNSAGKLENAYNEYVKGQTRWQGCFDDLYCDFKDSEAGTQTQAAWRKAGRLLTQSSRIVENIQP